MIAPPLARRRSSARALLAVAAFILTLAGCATAPPPAPDPVTSPFETPALAGSQWGLVVARPDGTRLYSLNADARFLPASNMKVLTSAGAFAHLGSLDAAAPGTLVQLERRADGAPPDLALIGGGDPSLGDGPACETQCLSDLADQVAASGTTTVTDIIGDESWFPPEPHIEGWSWDDLQWAYGAPVSALSINQNTVTLAITPGTAPGSAPAIAWAAGDDGLMTLINTATTSANPDAEYRVYRALGSQSVTLSGDVPLGAAPRRIRLASDDPARHAAERLRRHLEARGVAVLGTTHVRREAQASLGDVPQTIAQLPAVSLADAISAVSKDSNNLQAELLLRHLGKLDGDGSTAAGHEKVETMLAAAGIAPEQYDLADGSGLSIYNRITPAAMVDLLLWIDAQPWGADWIAAQPVGAVDGSLDTRFAETPLAGKINAKTGTLFGANTLSGFLETQSGERLVFSVMVNDRDREARTATPAIDAALLAIAENY